MSTESLRLLFLVNLGATLFMFGVITLVQVVHYPLFARVGAQAFAAYEASHTRLITFVVFPPMVLELLTGIALVWLRPAFLSPWVAWVGLALIGLIWLSTAFLQVPLHGQLAGGFVAAAHDRLVATNWIRTVAWAARSALLLWVLNGLLRSG